MSNRQFKTLLNNQNFVLFDYGIVNEIPQIDINLSGICNYNNIYYLKQRNSLQWIPIIQQKKLLHLLANGDDDIESGYYWFNEFYGLNNENNIKFPFKNNLMIWNHNYNDTNLNCEFFMGNYHYEFTYMSDMSSMSDMSYMSNISDNIVQIQYEKIYLPYIIYDENTIVVDFNGLHNSNNKFFIVCN